MSIFRRAGSSPASSSQVKGIRPWLHGEELASTGVSGLDGIFGGGIATGNTIILQEDDFKCHSNTINQCFVGEGVACGHRCLVVVPRTKKEAAEFLSGIPKEATGITKVFVEDKKQQEEQQPKEAPGELDSFSLSPSAPGGSGLNIAWQYEKYLTPEIGGGHRMMAQPRTAVGGRDVGARPAKKKQTTLATNLDLSQPLDSAEVSKLDVLEVQSVESEVDGADFGTVEHFQLVLDELSRRVFDWFDELDRTGQFGSGGCCGANIQPTSAMFVTDRSSSSSVGRLCFPSFLSRWWSYRDGKEGGKEDAVIQFVKRIKRRARLSRCLVQFSVSAALLSHSTLKAVMASADLGLKLTTFEGMGDTQTFHMYDTQQL